MKKLLSLSLIGVLFSINLSANEGLSLDKLKKIPLNLDFLSTENGGNISAIDAYSDGIGIYTVGLEDKKFSAMNELVFKYGEEAKQNEEPLKSFVLNNGSDSEKELAALLGDSSSTPSFRMGDSCDDNDSSTTNDRYTDTNGTCHGNYIPVISSLSGWGDILELGTIKTLSINASDSDGDTLSYTYYVINVSNDNAIVSEQNIGNNSSFNLDIASPLFVYGNQYKIRIKASDGYNDAFFETIPPLDVVQASNIVILANGTVTCKNATPDTTEIKDGVEYYIAPYNKTTLANKIKGANGVLDNGGDDFPTQRICITHVKDMNDLFRKEFGNGLSSINQDFHNISNWDTSKVTHMATMFYEATNFNQDISNWDTSNLTYMPGMFYKATNFNQDISNWDTSKVTYMRNLFADATNFNQDISNWDTSNVTDMAGMFQNTKNFNQAINFDTSKVTNMLSMFAGSNFNQPINFDTSNVTDMSHMFQNNKNFNQAINFDTSKVTNMYAMFAGSNFNQPINFDTSNVTNMAHMFASSNFNQPINFNTSNVTDMAAMFQLSKFNQPINFNVPKVTSMNAMFLRATDFNKSVTFTNSSNLLNTARMFEDLSNFNSPITINTSNVTDMWGMFLRAANFNQNISNWNVAKVNSYHNFRYASALSNLNTPIKFR